MPWDGNPATGAEGGSFIAQNSSWERGDIEPARMQKRSPTQHQLRECIGERWNSLLNCEQEYFSYANRGKLEASANTYTHDGEWSKCQRTNVGRGSLDKVENIPLMEQLATSLNSMAGGELKEPSTTRKVRLLSSQRTAIYLLRTWGSWHSYWERSVAVCTGVTRPRGNSCSVPSIHKNLAKPRSSFIALRWRRR